MRDIKTLDHFSVMLSLLKTPLALCCISNYFNDEKITVFSGRHWWFEGARQSISNRHNFLRSLGNTSYKNRRKNYFDMKIIKMCPSQHNIIFITWTGTFMLPLVIDKIEIEKEQKRISNYSRFPKTSFIRMSR